MATYCGQCGHESGDESRFCSACGQPLKAGASTYAPGPSVSSMGARLGRLVRPRVGRKIAGVCQGLTNLYGWDVTVVRVVMVLLAIVGFPIGLIVYGLFWLIAPEEVLALPAATYVSHT